ncbi:conjugative transfer system coupling protein TraD [Pandoraea sp. NPDC090278]|uniref:conjugative transfer system coupling protein TraD n=1 Tax=Pandoraea sp. NPDC090278 TaxID=3364391 RepID=UPI00383A5B70
MKKTYLDMFRPNYDVAAAAAWSGSLAGMIGTQPPYWWVAAAVAAGMSAKRINNAIDLYRFRQSLSALRIETVDVQELLNRSYAMYKQDCLYMGEGFKWQQQHSEIATNIMRGEHQDIPPLPAWMPNEVREWLTPKNWVRIKDTDIGVPWIHGIEPEEIPIGIPFGALTGHTLITGTTRAGKTKMYELITTQLVYQKGNTCIVIDPKGDKDWEKRLRLECERAGRKFLYMHPAHPSKSIRLDVLANWNNLAEPATRIGQLVDAEGTFAAFAWKTLYRIMRGQVADGQKPSIRSVKRYTQMGVEPLLESILTKWFVANHPRGSAWDGDLEQYVQEAKGIRLGAMILLYMAITGDGSGDETIDALIAMVKHSKEHYSKMIQVLEPILEMLGSDEIGKLLSPDPTDINDPRPIYNMKKIIDEGAVLYVALDSLSNKIIGSAMGSIILADLASVCGSIYNFENQKNVFLFVDEAAEVINDQLIQILNKGGGAGFKCFLAAKTDADFIAKLGSKEKARQVLGNLNNVICLRIKDYEMAKWIAESFGMTGYRQHSEALSMNSASAAHPTEFTSGHTRSVTEKDAPFVSPDLLTRLPAFNYFAFLGGSTLYKGRYPMIN